MIPCLKPCDQLREAHGANIMAGVMMDNLTRALERAVAGWIEEYTYHSLEWGSGRVTCPRRNILEETATPAFCKSPCGKCDAGRLGCHSSHKCETFEPCDSATAIKCMCEGVFLWAQKPQKPQVVTAKATH